jgi:uncharacterized membrane protein
MLAAAAVTLLVAPAVAHAAGASGPTALELLPGMTRGVARAVNAAGVIVGDESTGTHPVPVRWVNGHVTALEIPAGYTGSAVDVNNAGTVIGNLDPHTGVPTDRHLAVTWDRNGRMTSLAPGRGDASVTDINDLGEIVGVAYPPGAGHVAAVRFVGGTVQTLVSRADADLGATMVANRPATDLLAGLSHTDRPQEGTFAFVAGPGGAYTTLPGRGFVRVMGISADGTTIAGMADSSSFPVVAHPVLWRYDVDVDSGQRKWFMWDLGTVFGAVFQPSGLSPDGTTMAGSVAADQPIASVWRDGSYYLLRTGFYAEDVNNAGLVVGMDSNGRPVTWTVS